MTKQVITKHKQKLEICSGVYILDCKHSNMTYIGETGKKFTARIKEHKRLLIEMDKHSNDSQYDNKNLTDKFKVLTI